MALANTPFRTYLDKKSQRQFTIDMKPFGITGANFSQYFKSYIEYDWENRLAELIKGDSNPTEIENIFFAAKLSTSYYGCNTRGEYKEKCGNIGRKLFVYLRLAAKTKAAMDRKSDLEANLSGKVDIEGLQEMFPNVYFEKNYFHGKHYRYKLYLYKEFNAATKARSFKVFNQYTILGKQEKYYDPAEVAKLVNELIANQTKFYEEQLLKLSAHTQFVKQMEANND